MEFDTHGAKDAILAEYNALRSEILQRSRNQHTVINWLVVLLGVIIGIIAKEEMTGTQSFFIAILKKPDDDTITSLLLLSVGFSIIFENLMLYWLYQLFMIFRIANYLILLQLKLNAILNTPNHLKVIAWDYDSRLKFDIFQKDAISTPLLVKLSLNICHWIQPLFLFILTIVSLMIAGWAVKYLWQQNVYNNHIMIFLTLSYAGLLVIMLVAMLIYIGLNRWVLGYWKKQMDI